MPQEVFIVHRWDGSPDADWYPWLQEELEDEGVGAYVLDMPDSSSPVIEKWVTTLMNAAGLPGGETCFVGHSVGCQTILRYLEALPPHTQVGGVILVAPWFELKDAAYEEEGDKAVARPWLEKPLDWDDVKGKAEEFAAIFSEDDPYVPLSEVDRFQEKLNATVQLHPDKGHFTSASGVTEMPSVLETVRRY